MTSALMVGVHSSVWKSDPQNMRAARAVHTVDTGPYIRLKSLQELAEKSGAKATTFYGYIDKPKMLRGRLWGYVPFEYPVRKSDDTAFAALPPYIPNPGQSAGGRKKRKAGDSKPGPSSTPGLEARHQDLGYAHWPDKGSAIAHMGIGVKKIRKYVQQAPQGKYPGFKFCEATSEVRARLLSAVALHYPCFITVAWCSPQRRSHLPLFVHCARAAVPVTRPRRSAPKRCSPGRPSAKLSKKS